MSNPIIISFSADVATKYGDRAAYFLAYLQYCIETNKIKKRNHQNNHTWTYNSMEGFLEKYPWLTRAMIKKVIADLLEKGVILKCNAKDDLGVKYVNFQTNAYAFADENEWLPSAKNDETVGQKNPTTPETVGQKNPTTPETVGQKNPTTPIPLDKKNQHVGQKKPTVGHTGPTYYNSLNNSLNNSLLEEIPEIDETDLEKIEQMWIKTFSRTPKMPEIYETQKLIREFGEKVTEDAMRKAVLGGGRAISWARNRLEDPEKFEGKNKQTNGGYENFTGIAATKTGTCK